MVTWSLCKNLFPKDNQHKFLPLGVLLADLAKFAAVEPTMGDSLAQLYVALGNYGKQAACQLEACISRLQSWASKYMLSGSALPALSAIAFKNLTLDGAVFAALKAMRVDLEAAEKLLNGHKDSEEITKLAQILTVAKAFFADKVQLLEDRILKMLVVGKELIVDVTPIWKPYVLVHPNLPPPTGFVWRSSPGLWKLVPREG